MPRASNSRPTTASSPTGSSGAISKGFSEAAGRAALDLLHLGPSVATTLAAVAFAFALRVPPGYLGFVLRTVAVPMLLTQFAISVLNDWADRERDARSSRVRPVPAGIVPPSWALGLAIGLAVAAILWSLAQNGTGATLLLTLGLLAGFTYDLWLKPTPASVLPFMVAFPLLLVWVSGIVNFGPPAWLAFLAGAPLALAIHLADALPDRAEDAAGGVRTLAVALGQRRGAIASAGGLLIGSAVMATVTLGAHPVIGILILLIGGGAGVAFISGMSSRWIVAGAAAIAVFAWLASGGW